MVLGNKQTLTTQGRENVATCTNLQQIAEASSLNKANLRGKDQTRSWFFEASAFHTFTRRWRDALKVPDRLKEHCSSPDEETFCPQFVASVQKKQNKTHFMISGYMKANNGVTTGLLAFLSDSLAGCYYP